MKTFVERRLVQIRAIADKKGYPVSCDIYYDDLRVHRGEQFVVKLHGHAIFDDIDEHFRAPSIRRALNMAIDFMRKVQ